MRKIINHLGVVLTLMLAMSVSGFAQKTTKQCLDSVVLTYSKEVFVYDGKGNNTEFIRYLWGISEWVKDWKGDYTYDNSGNRTQYIGYSWDNGIIMKKIIKNLN